MSQSASQWAAFAREVARSHRLWTVRDAEGFPAPLTTDGERAQPFWSSLARVRRIIDTVPAYAGFQPYEISWADFREKWVPGLTRDGIKVGVNWSGPRATGYDVELPEVLRRVTEAMERREQSAE